MAFITGLVLVDAPASALNNAGSEPGAKTDNTVAVKKIKAPDGTYAYVSAQAFRFWLRSTLELGTPDWTTSPVERESKIAYTAADPQKYCDDDLLGYMRAPKGKDAKTVTRISPFRVGTLVSVGPCAIVDDFGTMARQEGNPVPHEHQFYRAHLQGLFSLDLTTVGTFFQGERVGYKNLGTEPSEEQQASGLAKTIVRKQVSWRLPLETRMNRVSMLVGALAHMAGGAKQTLHYTDLTPAVIILAAFKTGNHPFNRVFTGGRNYLTTIHEKALRELLDVYRDQFLSDIYIGWAQGFLDDAREKLENIIPDIDLGRRKIHIGHPVSMIQEFTHQVLLPENAGWFD